MSHWPIGEAGADAVACLAVANERLRVNASPALLPPLVARCAVGEHGPNGPVDSRAHGMDSPLFSHPPSQDEVGAHMVLLLKRYPSPALS